MEIAIFGKQFCINKILFFCVIVFLIIGSGVLGYFLKQVYQPLTNKDIVESNYKIIKTNTLEISDETLKVEEVPEIKIYVLGCVSRPGIVTLKKGQVIDDAIKLAGGATKEADLENINLAYKLNENTMLRIKPKALNGPQITSADKTNNNTAPVISPNKSAKTNKTQQKVNSTTKAASSKAPVVNKMNSGVDIITDSLGVVVLEEEKINGGTQKNDLVNINNASQADLEKLPNVGPATALAIITYREKNGGFKKITDIMKITGIKQKTYDKIKDFICIE